MHTDPYSERLFEMRLADIYAKHSWLEEEISLPDFVNLFPVRFKRDKPLLPDKPAEFDLDRDLFLEVLVAFRQSFR